MRAFAGRLPSETLSNDVRRGQIGPRVLRLERITPPVADCEDRARRDPRRPMRARLRNCFLSRVALDKLHRRRFPDCARRAKAESRSGARARVDPTETSGRPIRSRATRRASARFAVRRGGGGAPPFSELRKSNISLGNGNAARRAVAKKRNSDCLLVRRRRFSEWRQARAMQPGKIPIWRNQGFANPENRETEKRTLTRLSQVRNART